MNSKIVVSESIKKLSDTMARRSAKEANYFPIDRDFIHPFVQEISHYNPLEFILYNIEGVNPTYSNQLFLCLPELWEKISIDDIALLMENFTNAFSYYALIEFSYKNLSIDILDMIVDKSIVKGFYPEVSDYLARQWHVLPMSNEEREDLQGEIGKEVFHYNQEVWDYIRQRLLIDNRVKEAKHNPFYLKEHVRKLVGNVFD